MALIHNLGFPRIGAKRELKFALEAYWKGQSSLTALEALGKTLRQQHWQHQAKLDWLPVGDFSFYDQVLDMSFTLGNLPERVQGFKGATLDNYFRVARGRSVQSNEQATCCVGVAAGEMTKWFDTNYHYIVPEFKAITQFKLDASRLLVQIAEAQAQNLAVKPVIIGPVTYLWLGKSKDNTPKLALLERLLPIYVELLHVLNTHGIEWVQIDEPILVTELDHEWLHALEKTYHTLKSSKVKLLLATYFGSLQDNLQTVCSLPVAGVHLDAINARAEVSKLVDWLPIHKILSLGVINGRNIWKTDLNAALDWLEPIAEKLQDRLWLAPSCSLLHVPVDLESETDMDAEIRHWLAFARQKLSELQILQTALNQGREVVATLLADNQAALHSRQTSQLVHNPEVSQALQTLTPQMGQRHSDYNQRAKLQHTKLNLPKFPTTTIGSFPQTAEIRTARLKFKKGELSHTAYIAQMQQAIQQCVREQESLELDVLVHGEAERNDMVEYFGEQLNGYVFSQFGWVQSYGSRCVKPPILFGDISRPNAMTLDWIQYAQC